MTASSPPPLPPHRLKVLVVRHGETHENVAGIIQGQLDTDLNAFGRLQAATTARHLSTVRLDRIITSPLRRARDTAQAILEQQPASLQLELEQDHRLKERAFGVLEGKVYVAPANRSGSITGIEEKHDLLERLAGFWNELVTFPVSPRLQSEPSLEQTPSRQHGDDERVILLISHGATISALLDELLLAGQYLHLPLDFRPSRRANCSITEIVVPTISDRRFPSSATVKPAGDVSLGETWTIKPPHLGIQGCQRLLEIQNLKLQLAHWRRRQTALDDAEFTESDIRDYVHQRQARLELLHEGVEKDGGRGKLEKDVLRGPDGEEVMQDLGYGKGVGYLVKWADTTHLQGLMEMTEEQVLKHSRGGQVNVDELVEKTSAP